MLYVPLFHCTTSTHILKVWIYLADAYDPLDPNGNITIKWDVMSWTGDGYVVSKKQISIYSFMYMNVSTNPLDLRYHH